MTNITSITDRARCPRCAVRYDQKLAGTSRATEDRDIMICPPCCGDESATSREYGRGVVKVTDWPIGRDMWFPEWDGDYCPAEMDLTTDVERQSVTLRIAADNGVDAESITLDAAQIMRLRDALEASLDAITKVVGR